MSVKPVLLSLVLLPALTIPYAYADWQSMLGELKNAGETLLSDESTSTTAVNADNLNTNTVIAGLKQALELGSQRAINSVSATDGFLSNPLIRIPLPPQVEKAGSMMRKFGLDTLVDEFETSMNHAAEQAAPEAKSIMLAAIKNMSIDDAKKILNGSDNAATTYFRENTQQRLTDLFKPTIAQSLDKVGSTQYYNQLNSQVSAIPVVGQNLNVNLPDYVTAQALDGLFTMLAAEEKKIRENPAKRTTELLKTVFGQ